MARSLIEEFKIENPQYKDVDDSVFNRVIIEDFKSEYPQYKDMSDDFFTPMLNPPKTTTMEKAAEGATGLVKKATSAFVPSIPKTPAEALDKTFPPLAIGEKAATVNKDLEESVDKYPLAYNGLDRLNAAMARTPAFAFDAAMLPGNLIRKAMGQPQNQVQSPDWLMNNKVAEFYDESVRQTDYVNKRWEGVDFEKVVKNGDAKEITEFILHNVMASAPQNLAILGLAATGFGNAGVIGMGILSAADELKRARDMGKDPAMSALNAAEVGTFEAAFEKLGTLAFVEKWGGQLAKSFGKDTAFGIMKNVGKAMLSAVGVEGFEEVETSLSQDFARWSTGIDPNALKGSGWRAAGAFAVGGVAGGMMTAPATIATGLGSAVTTINSETLTPETMAQLDNNLPAVSSFLKKIPTINVPPEKVNEAIITASVAKVDAMAKGKSPEDAEIDSLHAFTKTLDPEPLVPRKKKAEGIIEYIKGWGGVDSTKEGGSDFAELEIKGLVNDKKGKSPDHLVEIAIEDGFLPEQSTYNDLLALVEREQSSGRPVLRPGDEAEGTLPERPLDSMSIETLDREIDRYQEMLGQGKAGKSIQQRLADLLETRKRRAQSEAEDPEFAAFSASLDEVIQEPVKFTSESAKFTPGQVEGDAELARLAKANQVEDDLIVSLVDKIDRDDEAFKAGYGEEFDQNQYEIKGVIKHTTGGQFKAIIELASGATRKTARHEFMHFARKNLLDEKQAAVLEDAFQGNQEDEADAFGLYMQEGSAGNSLVDKVFKVLKDFVGSFGNWMKGRGFQTVEDIFKAIDQGKLGKRKSSRVLTPKDIQFSVEPKQIKDVYENSVNDYFTRRRDINLDTPVPVLAWSDILVALKASKAPVVIPAQHLGKARYDHDVAVEDIMKLPDELRDPVMVFTSGTVSNSYVFLTGLKNTKGKPVAAAIHLDQRMGHGGRYVVHKIATLGDRDLSEISIWLKEGRLRYKNPQKATAWLQSNGLYAAKEEVAPSGTNIAEDKNNVKPQFSVERRAPTFFSAAEVILKEKMPNVASVAQVRAILSGIKQEEVKWLGVEQFLEGKEKVSKADMLDFVRANQVKVEEVMKSDGYVKSRSGRITPMDNGLFRVEYPGLQDQVYKTMEEATDELDAVQSRLATEKKETKFKSYQLPGGENYRELLLTLPIQEKFDPSLVSFERNRKSVTQGTVTIYYDGFKLAEYGDDGPIETNYMRPESELMEIAKKVWMSGDKTNRYGSRSGAFTFSHFDEPNILAHVRFNERTGPKGERILFLEEVQSDWHQQGREKGYDTGGNEKLIARKDVNDYWVIETADGRFVTNVIHPEFTADQAIAEGKRRLEEEPVRTGMDNRVPDAPFKKTWHELALKRMLRYAAENGFDQLAWTTGEQQAERYDLSKQISKVSYSKNGTLDAWDLKGTPVITEYNVAPEKLVDYIGKDAAKKIIDQPWKPGHMAAGLTGFEEWLKKTGRTDVHALTEWRKDSSALIDQYLRELGDERAYKEISGLDLKVGGEGMKGFYDQILPSFLNKYAKKWGGRVGTAEIAVGDEIGKFQVVLPNGKVVATESTRRLAENTAKNFAGATIKETTAAVHALDITPSMKRDVLEVGQIQFSVERKDEPQVGQAIKAISDSIKAKEVGGDYTLGDGETIKAEDLVDSMTLGEVTKEKAAGFLKAVKKGIHFLELPQNYLYAHEDSKPVAEGVIDAFVARERREHDIEEFKRMALSAPNPEALAEIVAAADRDNDVNIFAELTKAVKAGKITQADKEAFTKGLYFIHKAAKDQLIRDILASRVGVRIKSMGVRYLASYETKDGKAQERWLTGTQMRALEARGTKVTVLEEKEQIRIKRGSPEKGEIIESTRKVSSYDEALSILKEEEKQIIRELLPYRNYIPHARRGGRFWVEAYDQEGQKVYSARVPNESVAARMSELIGKEHPDWRIDAHPHSEKMRITPSFGSMADVQFFMNQNGIDPTSEPGQRIINAYRSVSPLMASLIHSQNIAGYKVDWDSIVDSMALMASSGSGRAYRLDVKDLMDDVKNIKDDFRFNTALQYVNALSEVQEDMPVVLQSIKSLTYFWLLANKSTYVIQNLTEPIWALARIESIKNPAGFAIVLNDEYKALLNRATEEGIFKPFFSEQALAMNPLENLQKLDILGRASEVWSSRKVFEIGLRLARDNGLRGNEAYRYAYQFLFNKGKPFYSTANKPIGMLGKGWAVNRQYGFMLLNFMFDWLGKFARGMLRNKLMTLMAWVLLGGFGTLPFGRKLMELFKFQFEKNARNYDLLDRFMLGGIAGMLGISPSFIVPTVLKGIPLPSVNPFRSIDIIGNQIGFAAKSYEKYGIVGAAGYLPLAGGQYILRGQARLKDGFKDNKKIIYRPRTNYEKLLVGAGLNPFEVNEYYRTKENAK